MTLCLRFLPPTLVTLGALGLIACGGSAVESVGDHRGSGSGASSHTGGAGGSTGGAHASGGSPTTECDTSFDCEDGDPCTANLCEAGRCVRTDLADDGDPCTVDSCDESGVVTHSSVADDGDACTLDLCDALGSVQNLWLGDDGDQCTDDYCDPIVGPIHVPVSVDDFNLCTLDYCDPLLGVQHVPVDVDDGNLCTVDACSPMSGTTHEPVVCPTDPCGSTSCEPDVGCVTTPAPGCCLNLAPLAVPSMSAGGVDGGAGSYGPSQLNDGVTQSDACWKFSWITNGPTPLSDTDAPFYQLTWKTPVTIRSIYVDTTKASAEGPCQATPGRNLKGAKLQWWTGTAWATSTTFDNRTNDFAITLPNPVTTTALRLYDVTAGNINTLVYEWFVYPTAGCTP